MNEPLFMTNNSVENLSARLLKQRTVLLFGTLDEELSSKVISSLLYLSAEDQEKPITLMINSAGGDETEALAIFDVMQSISCPIHTVCLGKAHGMAALLLAAGEKGERKMYANGEVMLTQVSRDRTFGQASDIELETEHLLNVKERVAELLAQLTGTAKEKIQGDLERKHWLFANQALEYGIIDKVI